MEVNARLLVLCAVGAFFLGGCASSGGVGGTNPQVPEPSSMSLLRPFDSLNVSLQGVPDGNLHVLQIDDQGLISLPLVGTLKAAGIGPSELQQRIRETYIEKKVYTNLAVAVSVTERYVYVGGEV